MPDLGIPNTKFILPTAPNRPISLNGGMSMPGWTDIIGLDAAAPEDREGFEKSAERVNKIIQKEIDSGIPSNKIILAGFSQGGALALHVSLRSKFQLGGCIALSTWLPLRDDYPEALSDAAKNMPILQVHGDEDMVVEYEMGKGSFNLLNKLISDPKPKFLTISVSFLFLLLVFKFRNINFMFFFHLGHGT